jgi:hypothetical protein
MQKLAARVDLVTQADRRFFLQRPDRKHRVRFAAAAEIEQTRIASGEPMAVPPGCRFFTIVKNIVTGTRLRLLVLNEEGAETDLSEEVARTIWEEAETPHMREVEAQLRKVAGVRS